jgi:hypothetical protein
MTDHLRLPADASDAACAALDARLMDYLEGDLAAADRATLDAHLVRCARCAALVADLRGIAADAAALPVLRPERDLWAGIAARIEAPVVPLPARDLPARDGAPALHVQPTHRRAEPAARAATALPRRWLAAAAVALMAATSGVTYLLTRGGTAPAVALSSPSVDTVAPALASAPAPTQVAATSVDTPAVPAAAAPSASPAAAARLVARRPDPAASVPGVADYDRAIASLRTAVRERRADLDSGTVAVLERNLRIIDEAIRQSREALAGDPGSPMLERALTKALDQKTELLRTAALLPRA